jgi:hypothetical protein
MGEFLDAGFRLYRRHLRMLIGLTLMLGVVPLLLSYPDWLITNVAALMLFCFFYPAALFVCASATAEGKTASLRWTLRETVARAPRLLALALALALVVPAVMCVVPPLGLWMLVRWSVACPVMLVEGLDVGSSLRRSSMLIRGHWWSSFSRLGMSFVTTYVVLYSLVILAALLAIANPLKGGVWSVLSVLFVGFALTLALPLIPIAITVLYRELRRAEGSDLEKLAKLAGDAP